MRGIFLNMNEGKKKNGKAKVKYVVRDLVNERELRDQKDKEEKKTMT